jgi:hypothetical protein
MTNSRAGGVEAGEEIGSCVILREHSDRRIPPLRSG